MSKIFSIITLGVFFCTLSHADIKPLLTNPIKPSVLAKIENKGTPEQVKMQQGYQLQAIKVSGADAIAIINGKIVMQGERLNQDVIVHDIKPGQVTINNKGTFESLFISPILIKKQSGHNYEE